MDYRSVHLVLDAGGSRGSVCSVRRGRGRGLGRDVCLFSFLFVVLVNLGQLAVWFRAPLSVNYAGILSPGGIFSMAMFLASHGELCCPTSSDVWEV